jgi:hypothetical protein
MDEDEMEQEEKEMKITRRKGGGDRARKEGENGGRKS